MAPSVELLWRSSLCGIKQAALVASDITVRNAVFVLLRVTVGHKGKCSGKYRCQQTRDSDATSQRACGFGWLFHLSIPPHTKLPRINVVRFPRPGDVVMALNDDAG